MILPFLSLSNIFACNISYETKCNREYDYFGNEPEFEYDYFPLYSSTRAITQKYSYLSTRTFTPSLVCIGFNGLYLQVIFNNLINIKMCQFP